MNMNIYIFQCMFMYEYDRLFILMHKIRSYVKNMYEKL